MRPILFMLFLVSTVVFADLKPSNYVRKDLCARPNKSYTVCLGTSRIGNFILIFDNAEELISIHASEVSTGSRGTRVVGYHATRNPALSEGNSQPRTHLQADRYELHIEKQTGQKHTGSLTVTSQSARPSDGDGVLTLASYPDLKFEIMPETRGD